jgi:hypothetical protein
LKALTAGHGDLEVTNEEQARYWNGDEAVHWLVHEERYVTPAGLLLGSRAWLVTASRP